jgi:hypothetical protein
MEKVNIVSLKSPRNMSKTELQVLLRSRGIPFSSRETIRELQQKLRTNGVVKTQIVIPTAAIDLKSPVLTRKYVSPPLSIPNLQERVKDLEAKQEFLVEYIRQSRGKPRGFTQRLNDIYKQLLDMGFKF